MCWRVSLQTWFISFSLCLHKFSSFNSSIWNSHSLNILLSTWSFSLLSYSQTFFLLNLHCFGDWIWKQDLMIKPYIFILLCTIDVHFHRLVCVLKMTCWCSNKVEMHYVIYIVNYSRITVAARVAEGFFFFSCEFLASKKTKQLHWKAFLDNTFANHFLSLGCLVP